MDQSSLAELRHCSRISASSKIVRRMAVPPPQQKFLPFSLSIVTTGAFQAAKSAVAKLPLLGMNQRIVVVAPMRESVSGATKRLSQDFPGRPSESAKTKYSKSVGSC